MGKPTIYDLLAKKSISEVTQTQINSATSVSDVDRATINFWKGPITVQRVLELRTYAHGLPIPELSAISSNEVANGGSATFKPSGTEIYRIQTITSSADMPLSLYDGTSYTIIQTGTTPVTYGNLYLTPTLYLVIGNTSGDTATCNVAYHTVGL